MSAQRRPTSALTAAHGNDGSERVDEPTGPDRLGEHVRADLRPRRLPAGTVTGCALCTVRLNPRDLPFRHFTGKVPPWALGDIRSQLLTCILGRSGPEPERTDRPDGNDLSETT